jgi:hypothetical protein
MTVFSVVFEREGERSGEVEGMPMCVPARSPTSSCNNVSRLRKDRQDRYPGVTSAPGSGCQMPSVALLVYLNLPDSIALTWLLHTARRALDCAVGIVLALVGTQARDR